MEGLLYADMNMGGVGERVMNILKGSMSEDFGILTT